MVDGVGMRPFRGLVAAVPVEQPVAKGLGAGSAGREAPANGARGWHWHVLAEPRWQTYEAEIGTPEIVLERTVRTATTLSGDR